MLEHNGKRSDPIRVNRGEKQGDPLSPFLVNAVIDWAMSSLDNNLGFSFGNIRFKNLGYADDIVLLGETRKGLSKQL